MLNNIKISINLKLLLFLSFCFFDKCAAVIYELNDTEYARMPRVFHVEPYEQCARQPGGVHCYVEVALVADAPSPLMDLITEYSDFIAGHYNHSLLRHNLCVTDTCKDFYDNTTDLVQSVEACLNRTMQERYGLSTKLSADRVQCRRLDEQPRMELGDMCMIAALLAVLAANVAGSLYDVICTDGKDAGNRFLSSLSMRRNWRKLVSPHSAGPDNGLERLQCLSFLKASSTVVVILAHAATSSFFFIDNTKFMEDLMKQVGAQFMSSAAIVVQTFFIISGFLLVYNLELVSEKDSSQVSWKMVPKAIVLRWFRLTPPYALALFYTMTINKFVLTGPHWYLLAMEEQAACRRSWWQHLLYINNYNDRERCMLHTWYLAADTQLFVLGLVIYAVCRSTTSRKLVLTLLMVAGVAIPLAHTYWQDLDGILLPTPERIVQFYLHDPTFTHVYKRGHTNIFSYVAGMSIGYLAYHAQKINYDVQKFRKYRILYYSIIPVGFALVLSGCVFYADAPRASLGLRMLFAGLQKPVWCLFFGVAILGTILKYEGVVRGLSEWHVWTPLARLCYCAYFLHSPVIYVHVSFNDFPHMAYLSTIQNYCFIIVMSFVVALPMWLLVEEPARQLLAAALHRPKASRNQDAEKETVPEEEKNTTAEEQMKSELSHV